MRTNRPLRSAGKRKITLTISAALFTISSLFVCGADPARADAAHSEECSSIAEAKKYFDANPDSHNREQAAIAYHNCGMKYADEKKWNTAEQHLQESRRLAPVSTYAAQGLAYVLSMKGREAMDASDFERAKDSYEKALRYDPKSGDIKIGLSQAIYRLESRTDRVHELLTEGAKQGTAAWDVDKVVKRSAREAEVEKKTREEKRGNWVLRYQENIKGINTDLIFKDLDDISHRIGEDFQHWIKHRVIFVLVDEDNFNEVQSGPGWAGALNDGRIKVPVGGEYKEPKKLKSVLAHEFTHSVINDLAHGHPIAFWIHEGLAEYEESKMVRDNPLRAENISVLLQALKKNALLPLSVLSEADAGEKLNPSEVHLAYKESLAFILYLEEVYHFYSILSMLKELGAGRPLEEAVVQGIGRNLNFLEKDYHAWLKRTIGKRKGKKS